MGEDIAAGVMRVRDVAWTGWGGRGAAVHGEEQKNQILASLE